MGYEGFIIWNTLPHCPIQPSLHYSHNYIAICVFLLYSKLRAQRKLFIFFDSVGLGVFTLIGVYTANLYFGENPLLIIIRGVITAIGILRDVLVNELPIVFTKEIYAAAAFLALSRSMLLK